MELPKMSEEELKKFKEQAAKYGFIVHDKKEPAAAKKSADKEKGKEKEHVPRKRVLHGSGFYKKKKVGFRKEYGTPHQGIVLRELDSINVKGAVMMTSFPSSSLASILSGGYLREKMELPLVAIISSHLFPSRCIIEKGIPSHSVRIFGDQRLVVVVCEFKIPPELSYLMAEVLLDFALRHEVPMIITIEGVPSESPVGAKPKLQYISTNKKFSHTMEDLQHTGLEEAVVGGITGAIMAEGSLAEPDVGCLLCPTSQEFPDASAAVTVVDAITAFISAMTGNEVKVDTSPLEEKASQLHASVEKLLSSERAAQRASTSHMYG
ncbi:hypothetical protein QOT17_013064 [Balamuthia mandrillaris]